MNMQETISKLVDLKLYGMVQSLKERMILPDHKNLSFEEFFGLVVDDEYLYRGKFGDVLNFPNLWEVLAKVKDEEQDKRRFKINNIEDLVNKVITVYELTSVKMLKTRITKVREAKSLFVYIGNVYLGKSYFELGRILGMTDYGAKRQC